MQYPIANDCIKLYIDGQADTQLVPKRLLQLSVRELHNRTAIPLEEVVLKEEIYSENNTTIIDSSLRNILPLQLKKMTAR